ncbi:hypothetical protein KP509_16G079100 [Ceratopteris richardii]|uniref:Uncharacterized protein n=1 Tax=Ceratopteris richardii TaxID=49495 RepID=A0A8T2T5Z2_CERRI|nr:hypothetical protein KP509_16G079100 [Ceratopteris richardii]
MAVSSPLKGALVLEVCIGRFIPIRGELQRSTDVENRQLRSWSSSVNVWMQPLAKLSSQDEGVSAICSPTSVNHGIRCVNFAFAAAAWATLSSSPAEATFGAYETYHTSSTAPLSGITLSQGDLISADDGLLRVGIDEGTLYHSFVLSPPNFDLPRPGYDTFESPSSINETAAKKKKKMTVKCPPWTISELQMVLPDYQGKPKPYPRVQGSPYPFWPAIDDDASASDQEKADNGSRINIVPGPDKQQQSRGLVDMKKAFLFGSQGDDEAASLAFVAPLTAPSEKLQPQQPIIRMPGGCFTM